MFDRSWFYSSEGQQKGPCSEAEFRDLLAKRKVNADTLVWSEGMPGWAKARDVPGLLTDVPQPTTLLPQGDAIQERTSGPGKMQELDVTLGKVLRVYWLFLWRSLVGSILIGFVLGFVIGFALHVFGAPPTLTKTTSSLAGAVIGVIWSVVCMRMAIEKQYSDFRIALVPRETGRD